MKVFLEHINVAENEHSFMAYHLILPKFEFKWHYHPEYEITLVKKGAGIRIIGDSFENFSSGDLVMVGRNIPHTWISGQLEEAPLSSTVIQFSEKFINGFLNCGESAAVKKLLEKSKRGIRFDTTVNKEITELVVRLPGQKGFSRVISFLELLNCLTFVDGEMLTSLGYQPVNGKEHESRINRVCSFIQKNFTNTLTVHQVANLTDLSDSAFCRFFKKKTGKTFSDYVNELRIAHACKLLTESDNSIAGVAAESGFESITYFNRIFLKKKMLNPRQFRKTIK